MQTPPTFLVLDDDATNRLLERDLLEREFPQCRVVECSTVASAVAATDLQHFDGIVTDHHLGQSDGAEFVRRVRANGLACPIVMVTNSSDPAVIDRAQRAGATRVFAGSNYDFIGYFRQTIDATRTPAVTKILIIDDDVATRAAIAASLTGAGFHTQPIEDGREALAFCQREEPQVVIVDLIATGQDGFVTLGQLRRHFPAVKVIAMSASGRIAASEYLKMAKTLGAAALLAKPFSVDELHLAVSTALRT